MAELISADAETPAPERSSRESGPDRATDRFGERPAAAIRARTRSVYGDDASESIVLAPDPSGDGSQWLVDGEPVSVTLRREGDLAHLVIGANDRLTRATAGGGGGRSSRRRSVILGRVAATGSLRAESWEAVVDGWRFEIEVEPAAQATLRERARRAHHAGALLGPLEVRATIPGRVVAVTVNPGDSVSRGGQLMVVEAMKMQNEVRSPRAGQVRRVAVAPGQTIELGDLLAVVE